ncbi:group 1 glycosyl transferase [[Phormidium ambiguum] IAM M-71]|uniref:Group 1 glycosyl transferase n=1 Tax=[Phormidium ambiguum] IAM M-71 TaxID=454136 RepID=A0A1U7IS67_9CYAN|nr:glycosyltransferase family 4 protein [Phormidium ambiguum]OKH40209.1 group 1 glycosyl transferase [Phormidium ambiguum IAM M-71]
MNLSGKHLLIITSVYPLTPDGNHGTFIRELTLRLLPTKAKFTVFAPAYEACPNHTLDGIKVYRFRYCFKRWENLVRDGAPTKLQKQPLYLIAAALYILLGTFQLFWVCLKEKPDLLHVNWPFPHGLMALPASKLLKIPMIFSFHGGELLLAKKFGFVAHILRWLLPQASSVTANSSFTQSLVNQLTEEQVNIIPYGLTIEPKLSQKSNYISLPQLLFVGRLDERKGLRYLLEALPLVLAKRTIRLRVVGKGILEQELKSQCHNLGLDSWVDFLGFLTKEELANEYANCDIFVLPAIVDSKGDTEGLGIVIIEALAHGKPVIASRVGGIPDVINSGITGILIPQKDPESLANAILSLISNPAAAERMGYKGLEDIKFRFSWERIIPIWQEVFADVLDDRKFDKTRIQAQENSPLTENIS